MAAQNKRKSIPKGKYSGQKKKKQKLKSDSILSLINLPEFNPATNHMFSEYTGGLPHIEKFYKFLLKFYASRKKPSFIGKFSGYKNNIQLYKMELFGRSELNVGNTILVDSKLIGVYNQELINAVTNGIKQKNEFIFIPLLIRTIHNFETFRHANLLIIYPKHKVVVRFEPFGKSTIEGVDSVLSEIIRKEFREFDLRLVTPAALCPTNKGPQLFEKLSDKDKAPGYCVIFSMLYIVYSLEYDTTVDPVDLVKLMNGEGSKKVPIEIRRFTNFIIAVDKNDKIIKDIIN